VCSLISLVLAGDLGDGDDDDNVVRDCANDRLFLLPSERDVVVGVHRAGGMGRGMAGVVRDAYVCV
jgi:hypothetical protein